MLSDGKQCAVGAFKPCHATGSLLRVNAVLWDSLERSEASVLWPICRPSQAFRVDGALYIFCDALP